MPAEPKRPFSVAFCNAMIGVAARVVPVAQRHEWKQEWSAEIWHRWQFLLHVGEWNAGEAFRLIRNSLGAFTDAGWYFLAQDAVQNRVREWARSPWTCLSGLAVALLLLALLTSGLPAARGLFAPLSHRTYCQLVILSLHPAIGSGETGLPPDIVPAWRQHSRFLETLATFKFRHARMLARSKTSSELVITTEPELFRVLQLRPAFGAVPQNGAVLDHRTWVTRFKADPNVLGSKIVLDGGQHVIRAVLPSNFPFLAREPTVYLVQASVTGSRVMIAARTKQGVSQHQLEQELTAIAEHSSYYFWQSRLRVAFLRSTLFTPLRFFGLAIAIAAFILFCVCRFRISHVRIAVSRVNRKATARRAAFLLAKLTLALAFVFLAGLEWNRPASSLLLAWKDGASGPIIVWLYILGVMGVFSWCFADQRARCRVCLRLLCFPVRIGCPGCLLLDWSGTELFCAEGHGVLHKPHLAPSWDDESEHWISLDESWRELFTHT